MTTLPPTLLRRIGAALWGEPFQGRLADELEVSPRTVRRWLAGDMPIPTGVEVQLFFMIQDRLRELQEIADQMYPANSMGGGYAGKTENIMR